MALNLEAVGKPLGPVKKDYTWKDVVLYALGVGAGFDELEYCFEQNLKVIPSFSIASVFEFLAEVGMNSNADLSGILHGGFSGSPGQRESGNRAIFFDELGDTFLADRHWPIREEVDGIVCPEARQLLDVAGGRCRGPRLIGLENGLSFRANIDCTASTAARQQAQQNDAGYIHQ